MKSLEAIARNNLKMAGEDEVLVIINKPKETAQSDNQKKKNPLIKNKTDVQQKN